MESGFKSSRKPLGTFLGMLSGKHITSEALSIAEEALASKGMTTSSFHYKAQCGGALRIVAAGIIRHDHLGLETGTKANISLTLDGLIVTVHRDNPADKGSKPDLDSGWAPYADIEYSLADGMFVASQAELTPVQLWYCLHEGEVFFSNDLRLLRRVISPSLNDQALRLLLVYQSLPPSISPFNGISALPPMHRLELRYPYYESKLAMLPPVSYRRDSLCTSLEHCAMVLREELDTALAASSGRRNIISFSGGIDSSYLAARMKVMGEDCLLVHYSFDAQGEDTSRARLIAGKLGYPMEIIDSSSRNDSVMIERISADYDYPFGDLGSVTSSHLAHFIARANSPGTAVWEGTAADGLLAMSAENPQWKRLHSLPLGVRKFLATMHECSALSAKGRTEYYLKAAWRSAHQPFPYSAAAMKLPFAGVAVRLSEVERATFRELYQRYVFPLFGEHTAMMQPREILATFHRSARQVAPKAASPLMSFGLAPVFPFMKRNVLATCLTIPPSVKYAYGKQKPLLLIGMKGVLDQCDFAKKKSGFSPNNQSIFRGKAFQETVSDLLSSSSNDVNRLLDTRRLRKALTWTQAWQGTDTHIHKALWTYLFTSIWLAGTGASPK